VKKRKKKSEEAKKFPNEWFYNIRTKVLPLQGPNGDDVTVTHIPAVGGKIPQLQKLGQSGPSEEMVRQKIAMEKIRGH